MINQKSVDAVNASKFGEQFTKPLYNSYCFSNIPQTVKNLLAGEGKQALPDDVLPSGMKQYDKVVLFFIDSFGWRFFEKYQEKYPFLQRIIKNGVASKITSQFPSTTPAHVTCIHTGLPVGESGVYEWIYYEPKVDAMISPLMFTYGKYAGVVKRRDMLKETGIQPNEIYPNQTVYNDLKAHGIPSYLFQHIEYTPSPYSDVVFDGANIYPYMTLPQGLSNLSELLMKNKDEKGYYFLYFDKVDTMCHKYGPNSPQFEAEVDACMTILERLFMEKMSGKLKDTLFLMTADHGQSEIDPATTANINVLYPDTIKYFKTTKQGEIMAPAGATRDMFLYIKDEYLDEAASFYKEKLAGKAEVHYVKDLIDQGFFGPGKLSDVFLSRVANLVILPYRYESVWWYEKGSSEQIYFGHHGGLTPQEMETILFAIEL